MYGTSSLISAGVTSDTGSMPHAFAEAMRRRSSSMRSSVRATSMPPHSVKTSISRYCRTLSSVSCVISFEWSTRKMKFDACPVEPPGFGNGPLSRSTMSVHPSRVRWYARLLPTMPQPMTTARAAEGASLMQTGLRGLIYQSAAEDTGAVPVPHRTARIARSKPTTWARMTSSARSGSPSRIASRIAWCSWIASSRRSTRSRARNQIRSVST